jgi:hypothetical protein
MIPRILPQARILPQEWRGPSAWRDTEDVLWRLRLVGQRARQLPRSPRPRCSVGEQGQSNVASH